MELILTITLGKRKGNLILLGRLELEFINPEVYKNLQLVLALFCFDTDTIVITFCVKDSVMLSLPNGSMNREASHQKKKCWYLVISSWFLLK